MLKICSMLIQRKQILIIWSLQKLTQLFKKVPLSFIKGFWKAIGTSHNNVRMAKEDQVESVLKAKKGSVNIFSAVNDEKK